MAHAIEYIIYADCFLAGFSVGWAGNFVLWWWFIKRKAT
jgi:hypothetical protein